MRCVATVFGLFGVEFGSLNCVVLHRNPVHPHGAVLTPSGLYFRRSPRTLETITTRNLSTYEAANVIASALGGVRGLHLGRRAEDIAEDIAEELGRQGIVLLQQIPG